METKKNIIASYNAPDRGSVWLDPSDNTIKYFNGKEWVAAGDKESEQGATKEDLEATKEELVVTLMEQIEQLKQKITDDKYKIALRNTVGKWGPGIALTGKTAVSPMTGLNIKFPNIHLLSADEMLHIVLKVHVFGEGYGNHVLLKGKASSSVESEDAGVVGIMFSNQDFGLTIYFQGPVSDTINANLLFYAGGNPSITHILILELYVE